MGGMDNINWDQHKLTEKTARGVFQDKQQQEILQRAVSGSHRLIARQTSKGHIHIYVDGDGIVTAGGTGGGGRGYVNFEGDLRRAIRSVGGDFPRKQESIKQFQRRMQKNQGGENQEGLE